LCNASGSKKSKENLKSNNKVVVERGGKGWEKGGEGWRGGGKSESKTFGGGRKKEGGKKSICIFSGGGGLKEKKVIPHQTKGRRARPNVGEEVQKEY